MVAREKRTLCCDDSFLARITKTKLDTRARHAHVNAAFLKGKRWVGGLYQGDIHVDLFVAQEPVHETALGRQHVGVSLPLPHFSLLRGKLRSREMPRRRSIDPGRVGRRIELARLFQHFGRVGLACLFQHFGRIGLARLFLPFGNALQYPRRGRHCVGGISAQVQLLSSHI